MPEPAGAALTGAFAAVDFRGAAFFFVPFAPALADVFFVPAFFVDFFAEPFFAELFFVALLADFVFLPEARAAMLEFPSRS